MPEDVNPVVTEVKPDETTATTTTETAKPDNEAGGFKSKESKESVLADLAEVRKELAAFKDREAEAEKAKLSDIERAQAETAEKAKEASEAKAELARYKVAAKHKITDEDDLELLATAGDEATMERLAARIAKATTPGTPKPDHSGGARNEKTGTLAEQIAAAEKAGDKSAVGALKAQQLGALASNRT